MTSGTGGTPLWRLPAVRSLVVVSLLGFSSFCLTLASLPSWAVSGGVATGAAGLVTAVMLASTVATQAVVPALLTRFGTARTLVGGLLTLGGPAPLLAATQDLGPLLAISAARGTGFAVLTVVGATLTAGVAPAGRHGEAVGLYGLAVALPNLAAVPAGVALTQAGAFVWVAALSASPLLGIPAAVALGRSVPSSRAADGSASHGAAVRAAVAPSVVLLAVTVAGGGLVTFLPIERPTGLVATLALLAFGATGALTRWRAGVLADRIGSRVLLPASVTAAAAGMAVLVLGLLAGPGAGLVVTLGAALFGAGYGAVQNLTLVIAFARAGPGRTATASAVWNAAFDAGTGIGALAVGALAASGTGIPGAFAVSAVLVALCLPLTVGLRTASRPEAR